MGQARIVNEPGSACEDLLRAATVALEVTASATGQSVRATGFYVTPGIVVTCAHVLSETPAGLPRYVSGRLMNGQSIQLETVPEWYMRTDPHGIDLAFLRAPGIPGAQHVLLSGALALGDFVWTYGHPTGQFRGGQSAEFTYLGPSRLQEDGSQWQPHRLTGTPVKAGYSGSPVLNIRTGAVCGMLCISDEAGSAHMVSADDIVANCPAVWDTQTTTNANTSWLTTLSDPQIGEGGWPFPGPKLRAYLDAAIRAAADHPYPGVVPDISPPPITAVYVRQQAETIPDSDGEPPDPNSKDLERRPAEEILSRGQDCVLSAGPGVGKSSLLRTALITLARKWQRGEEGTEVPVCVLASDLIPQHPLPELIAAAVTTNLSSVGILKSWSPEFFGDQPLRGVRWLVLIDGLDEVLDPAARRSVLDKIEGTRLAEAEGPYRFIVATRPLPATEYQSHRHWRPMHYELQPFAAEQLTEFAERWFTELRLPAPGEAAQRFAAALDRARLADPARTPLMATMLCQLFAAHPDRALPAGRSGAYTEFVDLLRSRQYEDGTSGIYAQMDALLGRYGPAATGPGTTVLTDAMNLIARLAFHRQTGDDAPAIEMFAEWTKADQPHHVPEQKWRSFLREILRRSGVLTQRADDFQFIHQTVSEFLAAQHVTADADLSSSAYRTLFTCWNSDAWVPPPWDESYSRFLVAAWRDKSMLADGLRRLGTEGKIAGCRFIAALSIDSALPDPAIAAEATTTLAAIAENTAANFTDRRAACEILAQLQDPRGADVLVRLANERVLGAASRRQAAETLARIGDDRGANLLAGQADRSESDLVARQWAAESLCRLGDPRAAHLFADIAVAGPHDSSTRADAVRALIRLDSTNRADLRAAQVEALVTIATDSSFAGTDKFQASRALLRLGDHRGADLLAGLADDDAAEAYIRLNAAETLLEFGVQRAARHFALLAATLNLNADSVDAGAGAPDYRITRTAGLEPRKIVSIRRQAAETVARLDCADLLVELAVEPASSPATRYGAAEALMWIHDRRHTSVTAFLAADPAAGATIRLRSAQMLFSRGDPRSPDLLLALAVESALDMSVRCAAAWTFLQARDRRAALLRQILADSHSANRRWATSELARITGVQTADLLEVLAAERPSEDALDPHLRLARALADFMRLMRESWALGDELPRLGERLGNIDPEAFRLDRVFDERAQNLFAASMAGLSADEFPRRRAAEALASLGHQSGADMLTVLGADSGLSVPVRIEASVALARLGDHRAAELLAAVVRDRSLVGGERLEAAEALTLIDEPRSAALLTDLAADRSLEDEDRLRAAGVHAGLPNAGKPDLLARLATSRELDVSVRVAAADALSRLDGDRSTSLLAALAAEPTQSPVARIVAAESLATLDAKRATPILVGIATDATLRGDTWIRSTAAETLARLADPNTADCLAELAADVFISPFTRIEVAAVLVASFGDARGRRLLADIAKDPLKDAYARKWAADALAEANPGTSYHASTAGEGCRDDGQCEALGDCATPFAIIDQ